MEIKQRGSALGHKIILFMYKLLGYSFVAFIFNFVALYYVLCTPSVKKALQSYYLHQGIKLTNSIYFRHIKSFSFSIFDRFISRICPEELFFKRHNTEIVQDLQNGGIILQSHVGSWASGMHALANKFPTMNIVMKESTKDEINKVEESSKRKNEKFINIIDLNKGAIVANIQIANALMNGELVAMMADRLMDKRQAVEVEFFGLKVQMNKSPFDIAMRVKKPLVAIFVMNSAMKQYDLTLHLIKEDTIENMAQNYANILESVIKKHPEQWYNFYDYFKKVEK